MVAVVVVVDGNAAVMVVAVGVVTTGPGHCILCLSNCQLIETPVQTGLTSLPAV